MWILLILMLLKSTDALKCYENEENRVKIQDKADYRFCVIMPSLVNSKNGTQFGLEQENDMLNTPDSVFGLNNDDYRILTFCIFERYDFTNVPFYSGNPNVEFTFRCFCNYDLCNTSATMNQYLSNLKKDSFFGKK